MSGQGSGSDLVSAWCCVSSRSQEAEGTWGPASGFGLSFFILVVQDRHKGSLCDPGRLTERGWLLAKGKT